MPEPLAFHCSRGADRTGMAAAISLILFDPNATRTQIEKQVSWRYGVISPRSIGYQILQNYFKWLDKNNYQTSKKHFFEWLYLPDEMKPHFGWFFI